MHQFNSVGGSEVNGDVLVAQPQRLEIRFFGTTICADGIAGIVGAITVVVIILVIYI